MSTQWNQQLTRLIFSKVIEYLEQNKNKSMAKDHQVPNKWTKYKISELKCGNTKLLGNTKYNQVKLVLVVFDSAILYQVNIKLY